MGHRHVTNTAFGTSITTGTGINGAVLSVYRFPFKDKPGKMMRGEGHGRTFPSTEAAEAYLREHGLSAPHYRRAWCTKCRVLHTFMGRPTSFCAVD